MGGKQLAEIAILCSQALAKAYVEQTCVYVCVCERERERYVWVSHKHSLGIVTVSLRCFWLEDRESACVRERE